MTKRIAALLLILALVLSGCSWTPAETEPPQPAIDYSYDTQTITCSEGYGLNSFRKDVDVIETRLAQYGFEKNIPQAEREQFVEAAEAVLRELAGSEKPTFYVLSGYDGVCIQGNTLYTGLRDWESLDFATDVVLAAFGEFSHYGAAYGYASLLCDRLGRKSQADAPFAPPLVTETADLNLLCFREAFVSPEDVEAVKDLARGFASAQGEENIASLLAGSSTAKGMEALCSELETYYQENGFTYRPGPLRIGQGGSSMDYIVDTDLAVFYMGKDWEEHTRRKYGMDVFPENFLHQDYIQTRTFFDTNLQQMIQYQELFGLDDYNNDLPVVFDSRRTGDGMSFYYDDTHHISISSVYSIMHEYIHALTINGPGKDVAKWVSEGFATYFQDWYNEYKLLYDDVWYKGFMDEETYQFLKEHPEDPYYYACEFIEINGRPISYAEDFFDLQNVFAYSRGYTFPSDGNGYQTGSPFIGYLAETYGVREITQHYWGDHRELPKSHEALCADWAAYLKENYGQYSEYRP